MTNHRSSIKCVSVQMSIGWYIGRKMSGMTCFDDSCVYVLLWEKWVSVCQPYVKIPHEIYMELKLRCFEENSFLKLLNIGSIRMNILMLETRNVEQTKDVCMYTWRIYSSRDPDTLLHKVELNMHWKNTGLYTLASKEWDMWELLLGANWQVRINRITMKWETVTWVN